MKIALNTYSLRKEWELVMGIAGIEAIIKIIKMLDISEIELFDQSFHSEVSELENIINAFSEQGIHVFSIGPHPNPLTDPPNRKVRLDEFYHWTNIAAEHGIPMYRVSLGGGKYTKPDMKPTSIDTAVDWTVAVLEPALDDAESKNITLAIETHHQFSSNPEFQEKLLDRLPSKNLGFIFDIGNYETDELRWASLDVLIRKDAVKYVHAKAYAFDNEGFETTLDYPRAVKVLHDAGLDVHLSIEWEGRMLGPIGALKSNELCKYSIAKALGKEYEMKTEFGDEDEFMDALLGDE
ncbi:MAG: sugar phosphate isomerase/epimerase family protein [Promethearchaeota archaeon]